MGDTYKSTISGLGENNAVKKFPEIVINEIKQLCIDLLLEITNVKLPSEATDMKWFDDSKDNGTEKDPFFQLWLANY